MARRQYFTILLCCLLALIFADECTVDQYKCEAKGNCIGIDQICDGTVDCPDNEEDEWSCLVGGECIGPTKVCDGIKDCDDNEDEEECCTHSQETSPCTNKQTKDGWIWCKCRQTCIPPKKRCDGKNDCCGTIHGFLVPGFSFDYEKDCKDNASYTALDERQENGDACITECAQGEIKCLHDKGDPLPLKCIPEGEVAEKRCNGFNDCGTVGENDEFQENGDACVTTCADDEFPCSDGLPLKCVSQVEYCKGLSSCSKDKEFFCPAEGIEGYCNAAEESACVDENNRFEKFCIAKEKKCDDTPDCPSGSDEKDCSSLWWLWLLIVILILLLLILLLLFCLYKQGKIGRYNVKDPLTISENGSKEPDQAEPLNESNGEKSPEKFSPGSMNGGSIPNPISLHSPSGKGSPLASPVASPQEPLSSEGLSAAIKNDDFDWEGAAQQIIKDNRKKTSNIKIKPDQGFLMKEFPTDRIHEERPVSPIPAVQFAEGAPSSDQSGNPEYGHKKSWAPPVLESQVSETGEVVRYTGVTHAPVLIKSKKRYANKPIDYTDPNDF